LAIDWGTLRIGLAVSDELGLTAQGLPTLERVSREADFAALEKLIAEREVRLVVVGDPLELSGAAGPQSEKARRFGRALAKRCSLPLEMWDERFTSGQAESMLRQGGITRRDKQKRSVDRMAAVLILQSYLEARPAPMPSPEAAS